jgi:putative ABC transport system permease protein
MTKPPKLPLRFFQWFCHPKLRDSIEGDLVELYAARRIKSAKWKADLQFVWDVILLFRKGIIRPTEGYQNLNNYGMYKNYFTIAWRSFLKSKGYSIINLLGLAIGLASCLLIMLYVSDELSYDRFNEKADRIYRVNEEIKFGDNHLDLACLNASFGQTAKTDFPEIEQITRLRWYGGFLIKKGETNIPESNVAWADSTLFEVFTLPMTFGNPKTALSEPNSIVITESVARKYFDSTNVVGQTLTINNTESRKITGVIKDIPSTCHFQFTSFIPMVQDKLALNDFWAGEQNYSTYLLLRSGAKADELVPQLNRMVDKHLGPELKSVINKTLEEFNSQGDFFKISLTPLTDIHLHSNRIGELFGSGNIQYVYIFSITALFILTIAVINFMNLATARSANRAREVGVRKVMGSLRSNLIQQFIVESFLTCLIAMVLAVAITLVALPVFNDLTAKAITSTILHSTPVIITLIAITVVVGLLAGSYPAFYLSAAKPALVLKGGNGGQRKSFFRNTLVVFQFAASVMLISGTLIIFRQIEFINRKDLGYSREQIMVVNNIGQLGQRVEPMKNRFQQLTGVDGVTVTGYLPTNYYRSNDSFFSSPSMDVKDAISMQSWMVDENYIATMNMHILQGRNFSRELKADSSAVILNESAAKFLGNKDILDKKLYSVMNDHKSTIVYHVIGIVKDFNFTTLKEAVKPLVFRYGHDQGGLALKIATTDLSRLLPSLEKQWKEIAPELPFEYSFMDDDFNRLYLGEKQVGKLIGVFASLSIFISCLGLFGLATFMAEQRIKEIGIRKVLGASVQGITFLLSTNFLKLVLIAVVIACPVAYYFMNEWLQGFAYRVDIDWLIFLIAGVGAILIALFTVSY